MATKKKHRTILNEKNYQLLRRIFRTEEDYREKMQALWKTRAGLNKIMEEQPQFKEVVKPQLYAINDLIGALYNDDLPHPIYSESSTPEINLRYKLESNSC